MNKLHMIMTNPLVILVVGVTLALLAILFGN